MAEWLGLEMNISDGMDVSTYRAAALSRLTIIKVGTSQLLHECAKVEVCRNLFMTGGPALQSTANQPVIGMDIAKNEFQLHLVNNETSEIERHKLKRVRRSRRSLKTARSR